MSEHSPSSNLLLNLRTELSRAPPFAQMSAAHVDALLAAATEVYYAPGETVLAPQDGVARHLLIVRSGAITGRRGEQVAFEIEAGEMFPVGAVLAQRAVTAIYTAEDDVFALLVPAQQVRELTTRSAPFADFLNGRVQKLLDDSRRALQASATSQTLAQQSLEAPLSSLPQRTPVTLPPDAGIAQALALMHERRIGSVLVVGDDGAALGILTRHDVIGRITLPQLPMDTPLARVMTAPVHTLTMAHTAHEAALAMSRHGCRHVPVTEVGSSRVVSIVSERDLFALQRLSLKQVSTAIRAARDVDTLRHLADDVRGFARNLTAQGLGARALTELISYLNDLVTERLVVLIAQDEGLDLDHACWLAFGSEGRGEQTVATDQDNGLVFDSDEPERDRPRWLAFARRVNEALDACGYPLCKGNVMASNPQCCLTGPEWQQRFVAWMEQGAPQDLLNASIYFDLRPVAGRAELAAPLRALITERAQRLPRFMKQMADNALQRRPPLNWRGGIDATERDGRRVLDLKLQGTAIYVDVARLFALAHGVASHGTRERLIESAQRMNVPAQEGQAWAAGFEMLQTMRLQVQLQGGSGAGVPGDNPNLIDLGALNQIDRRVLKETLRVARELQQRLELDYQR
jgi:CBS domain-containing protein